MTNHIFRDESLQGNGRSYRENYSHYPAIIRQVAKETDTPLIDLEESMTRSPVSLDQLLHQDGLHLSATGNAIYASHLLKELSEILH
jgi:lysophospholipase L1-like esterase